MTALDARDRRVIGVLLVATFVVILNETVMGVAQPVIEVELGVSTSTVQWLTTAFLLTMGVVIPLTGFLIQRLGTRRLFGLAMSLFTAGTVLAAAAPGFGVLVAARVVQASGTAMMLPLLMTTVMTLVPAQRRGAMMGNISVVIAVAPALGPTLSGLVLENASWRWIFGVVAPISLAALLIGRTLISDIAPTRASSVDVVSVLLSVVGFGGLIYALVSLGHSGEDGGGGLAVAVPLVAGVVALAWFTRRQLRLARSERALLDLRVLASSRFAIAMVAVLLAMATMLGTFVLLPFFTQGALGWGPTRTGLVFLPGGIVMAVAAPFVGRAFDRFGPRVLLIPGTSLVSAGVWMFAAAGSSASLGWLIAANMVVCAGLAATFTPLMTAGLGAVRPALYAHGSAVLSTFQQVAGAAGSALFITVMTLGATRVRDEGGSDAAAIAAGAQDAFVIAGFMSFVLIAVVTLVRRPVDMEDAPATGAAAGEAGLSEAPVVGQGVVDAVAVEPETAEALVAEAGDDASEITSPAGRR